jgi:hypothetical protein
VSCVLDIDLFGKDVSWQEIRMCLIQKTGVRTECGNAGGVESTSNTALKLGYAHLFCAAGRRDGVFHAAEGLPVPEV